MGTSHVLFVFKYFTINFHFNVDWNCWLAMALKKSFHPLSSVTRCIIVLKNDFIITKPIFYQLNRKIIQNFYICKCIDCWGNDCHHPGSINDMQYNIMNDSGNLFDFFSQSSFHVNGSRHKFSIITVVNAESGFIIGYYFHLIADTPCLFLFSPFSPHFLLFVHSCRFSFGFSLHISHLFQSISYSSVRKKTDSYFDPLICLAFLYIYPIWISRFPRFQSQKLTLSLTHWFVWLFSTNIPFKSVNFLEFCHKNWLLVWPIGLFCFSLHISHLNQSIF